MTITILVSLDEETEAYEDHRVGKWTSRDSSTGFKPSLFLR